MNTSLRNILDKGCGWGEPQQGVGGGESFASKWHVASITRKKQHSLGPW